MTLNRQQIVETAHATLREHGLAALTMRRLAGELGVAPGALYWHVASKQELLAAVAEHILEPLDAATTPHPRQAACDLRAALLTVRDGAEVVSFALAFKPDALQLVPRLSRLFPDTLPPQQAEWTAHTLIYFVLGAVAEEQNRAELVRARVLAPTSDEARTPQAFLFGVDAILAGASAIRQTAAEGRPGQPSAIDR